MQLPHFVCLFRAVCPPITKPLPTQEKTFSAHKLSFLILHMALLKMQINKNNKGIFIYIKSILHNLNKM